MATYYSEFDSTLATIISDLIAQITSSSDWTKISTNTSLTTTSGAVAAGATSIPLPSGHGLTAGQMLAIDSGSSREWRKVATSFTTSVNLSLGVFNAHATGTTIYAGSEVLKATTTRGANMILDLTDGDMVLSGIQPAFWRSHTGAVGGGTDRTGRSIFWKNSSTGLTGASPLHCVVSAGKEHLFVSIEGPRGPETGSQNSSGSNKSYLFASDLVPYNNADTNPVIFAGGNQTGAAVSSSAGGSAEGHLSRNYANSVSWDPTRLGTITFPLLVVNNVSMSDLGSVHYQRQSAIDGKFYLFPYVAFSNADGPRGRLSSFFNAGFNMGYTADAVPPAPVGAKITYNGVLYKLVAVDRGVNTYNSWGQFGGVPNGASTQAMFSSNVVAVPCT